MFYKVSQEIISQYNLAIAAWRKFNGVAMAVQGSRWGSDQSDFAQKQPTSLDDLTRLSSSHKRWNTTPA